MDVLAGILRIVVPLFALTSMLSLGLGARFRAIFESLKDVRLNLRMLTANFLLVPALTFLILRVMDLDRGLEAGLILMASAAGAPFIVALARLAKADMVTTAGMLVLAVLGTLLFMPAFVPHAVEVEVNAGAIATSLLTMLLLPLLVGQFTLELRPDWARRLQPYMQKASSLSLVTLMALTVIVNFQDIVSIGLQALLAGLAFVVGSFLCGFLSEPRGSASRGLMGLMAGQRSVAASMLVASQSFQGPRPLVMVVTSSIVAMAALFPIARYLGKREEKSIPPGKVIRLKPRHV